MAVSSFYASGRITSYFGETQGRTSPHKGIDYGWPENVTEVPAWCAGEIVNKGNDGEVGRWVTIRRSDGLNTSFCHLKEPGSSLAVGSRISYGASIGIVGRTGSQTSGNHVHITTSWTSDSPVGANRIDPLPFINASLAGPAQTQDEDDDMYYRALNNSSDGLVIGGYMFVNAADGPLRALSNLEWDWARKAAGPFVAELNGNDIRALIKILGFRQQGPAQGLMISNGIAVANDGKLTGTIIF